MKSANTIVRPARAHVPNARDVEQAKRHLEKHRRRRPKAPEVILARPRKPETPPETP